MLLRASNRFPTGVLSIFVQIAIPLQSEQQFQSLITDFEHGGQSFSLDAVKAVPGLSGRIDIGFELLGDQGDVVPDLFGIAFRSGFGDSHRGGLPACMKRIVQHPNHRREAAFR